MKKRSNISVMFKLLKLVKPLTPIMILAVFMGFVGNLAATSITVLGGYAVADIVGFDTVFSVKNIFILIFVFAVFRGLLRYAEQACNHYIAFKLLADIRDKVFKSLRKLAPAKLEGKDKGNLISVITSDIELLEVFYAHTISPVAIAFLFCTLLTILIGSFHWLLGVVALVSYITIGVLVPVIVSKRSKDYGACFRKKSGNLSSFVLESLRGLSEIIQYGAGDKRLNSMNEIAVAMNMALVYLVLRYVYYVERLFGKSGVYVMRKLFGIILLAIAVRLFTSNLTSLIGSF